VHGGVGGQLHGDAVLYDLCFLRLVVQQLVFGLYGDDRPADLLGDSVPMLHMDEPIRMRKHHGLCVESWRWWLRRHVHRYGYAMLVGTDVPVHQSGLHFEPRNNDLLREPYALQWTA
jgi:hypothetical protein